MAPSGPNSIRIWPIACLIWSENKILGQKAIPGAKFLLFFEFCPGAGIRDAKCQVPGALLPRGNGFSVLRIFFNKGQAPSDLE